MVRRGTEGGNSLGTFFLFLFYGRLSLKTTILLTLGGRRYSNIRGWARLSSTARLAQLLLLEEKHKMRFLYNYLSSDDSIRRVFFPGR